MKKFILISILATISLLTAVSPVHAAKPANTGAETYGWHLSGDVMPVPPYGSADIPGSDAGSKLVVNQPNGNTVVTLTGVMNGLDPNTTYTVYLSKSYEPYMETGWNAEGAYILRLHYGGSIYEHDIVIDDQAADGTLTGTGGYPITGPPYSYPYNETVTGTIDPATGEISLHSDYENGYYYDVWGTIAPDGTMSGTWQGKGQPLYTWESISGHAVKTHTGDVYWPGLFTSTVQPFTFTTDENGSGSWHVNLRDEDLPGGLSEYDISVWVNGGGRTILISDNVVVVRG